MALKDKNKEELEQYSHNDLTYEILKERKMRMTTAEIFREICDLLGYSEDYYLESIADYYTALNLDKRFKLVDEKEWDLRENYPNDKEDEIDEEEDEEEIEGTLEEDIDDALDEEEDDEMEDFDDEGEEEEDELSELTIISEDELEE